MRGPASGGWGVATVFLCLGALLFGAYVAVTPSDGRSNDLGSHLRYVEIVERHARIPNPDECWECHQPPAYYVLGAAVLRAAGQAPPHSHGDHPGADRSAHMLRELAAWIALGTLACWLMTIRLMLHRTSERVLASALVIFYPTFTIDACKIGNDGLLYLFAAAALWQLVRWRQRGKLSALALAMAFAGLAPFAKPNGLVVVAIALASFAAAVWHPRPLAPRWPPGGAYPLALLATLLGAWSALIVLWKRGELTPRFVTMGKHLRLDNSFENLIMVHLDTFAGDPWAHAGGGHGRDELWNYLYRSSLYGEFMSRSPVTIAIAYTMAVLGVFLGAAMVLGLLGCLERALRRGDAGNRELVLTFLGFLSFLVVLRLRYPFAPHGDFRFILPLLLPCAIACARVLAEIRRRLARQGRIAAALPVLVVALFCACSTRILLAWP